MKIDSEPSSEADAGQVPPLRVMVMYENFAAGLRAKRSLDRISRQLNLDAEVGASFWRFDLLGEPSLYKQAAVEAATMDVVLLSVDGYAELPATVKNWMNLWLDHKESHPCAFGVLLHQGCASSPESNPIVSRVREVAGTTAADFFFGHSETPALSANSRLPEFTPPGADSSGPLEQVLNSNSTRWSWQPPLSRPPT